MYTLLMLDERITLCARYYTALDATQTTHQVMCDSDFQGQMKLFMNQGWKLIDICIDTMALAEGTVASIKLLKPFIQLNPYIT